MYTSGNILKLEWLDNTSNIIDNRYFGTLYCSGTNIIFSYDVISHMINNKDKINYDVIDDISFGLYIKNNLPSILDNINKNKPSYYVCNKNININEIKNKIFIRNRVNNYDRDNDIKNMKKIINQLNQKPICIKHLIYILMILFFLLLLL